MRRVFDAKLALVFFCAAGALSAACESSPKIGTTETSGNGDGDGDAGASSSLGGNSSNIEVDVSSGTSKGGATTTPPEFDLDTLTIVYDGPKTIDVMTGESIVPVQFSATVNGRAIDVGWSVDRGELATIDQDGVLTPTGKFGGTITVRAGLNGKIVEHKIQIRVFAEQNGPTKAQSSQVATQVEDLSTGGGIGGVGGEGIGSAIDDKALRDLFQAGPSDEGESEQLRFLYPYDGTLFPRGVFAPLLMWDWDPADADAVSIELSTTSGNYNWTGTFGRPEILASTGDGFVRHPIPQDVWEAATRSAGDSLKSGASDTLSLALTIALDGVVYGPISRTFAVAPGQLSGTVYYNSYGTRLVTNYNSGQPDAFGAAVLGIRSGDVGPKVVSGYNSGGTDEPSGTTGCRVCHTVASQGSQLLVQGGGEDEMSWWSDLSGSENYLTGLDGRLGWSGLSPDGELALTNAVNLSVANTSVGTDMANTRLFDMTQTPPVELTTEGLGDTLMGALPTFSPDGTMVSFAYLGGGDSAFDGIASDGSKLIVMDFKRSKLRFSNPRVVATGTVQGTAGSMSHGAGFPSIAPDNSSVIFMNEVRGGDPIGSAGDESYIATREGARGELWWASTASEQATRLNYANGKDSSGVTYIPQANNYHGLDTEPYDLTNGPFDDSTLNYEPTVNPVTSGGYAWVVFTSRRLYGNLATQDPWLSDPRDYDFNSYDDITTKKLWVAAISLDTPHDQDPSFPAFYLPGQELLAGNARGFWVLDPCRDEGDSCETGDQCCGGFCQPNGKNGALVCSSETISNNCAGEQEKCDSAADCCDAEAKCVGGFCARPAPPILR